jgi:metal-sulfur cluster biosynthetic enzyme
MSDGVTLHQVIEAIRPVEDPEIGISLIDLGLIYEARMHPGDHGGEHVTVVMTLTSPGCPLGPEIMAAVREAVGALPGVEDVEVLLVWRPPWNPHQMATEEGKDALGIW